VPFVASALERTVYPAFRRVGFRGQGRLRRRLPVAQEGNRVVAFPGGFRLALDLRESLQRDFLFGLYDRHELRLLRRALADGGDFVDVGAHIGMYTVATAVALGSRGRVLAFEPNPDARRQLVGNVELNGCTNVVVSDAAVAAEPGELTLHVPRTPDPSFSSLAADRFEEGEPVRVSAVTLDAEVRRLGLTPAAIKIDVEGAELGVLGGASDTLGQRPVLVIEVGPETALEIERRLGGLDYRAFRVTPRSLEPGLAPASGMFNAIFLPPGALDLAR
jgi:FkbM family methyltransferase